jgi:hypothetical protein
LVSRNAAVACAGYDDAGGAIGLRGVHEGAGEFARGVEDVYFGEGGVGGVAGDSFDGEGEFLERLGGASYR